MKDLGIVIIGRNEGDRLIRCIASVGDEALVIYVDSGSTDESVAAARSRGAKAIQLDMDQPFTAARARNAGRQALPSTIQLVQFIDGDCELQPGWLISGQAALEADNQLAVVFGRCREVAPEASRYNWLCDIEWAVPSGPAQSFGGIALVRLAALDAAGGYPDEMIAGEEPDLAIRMRALGWKLQCLPHEMVLHDAAMTRFGQWWRRARRSGHAMAELAARHPRSPLHDYARRVRSALFWGAILPIAVIAVSVAALLCSNAALVVLVATILLLPLAQLVRLALREAHRRPFGDALMLSGFWMLAKPAQSFGIVRYWLGRWSGARSRIMEYKM